MTLPLERRRIHVPHAVVMRVVENAAVLLDTLTGRYFRLDAVARRAWSAMSESDSLQQAYETLLREYDVTPEQLRHDLETLIEELAALGLIEVRPIESSS